MWSERMKRERQAPEFAEPLPTNLRVVMGVMSGPLDMRTQTAIRVIRTTWMDQPGVCVLDKASPAAGCVVHVAFVIGTGSDRVLSMNPVPPNETTLDKGIVRLDAGPRWTVMPWFRYASRAFPWATHIVKMDHDFFPHLRRILPTFASPIHHPLQYLGQQFHSHGCQFRMEDIRTGREKAPRSCCMYGGFYVMSRQLAEKVTPKGGYWEGHQRWIGSNEDRATGWAVSEYARRTQSHIMTLDAKNFHSKDIWDHLE